MSNANGAGASDAGVADAAASGVKVGNSGSGMVASLRTEGGSACPAVFAAAAPPGRTANDRSRRLVQIRDASVTHRRRYRSTRNGSREGRVPVSPGKPASYVRHGTTLLCPTGWQTTPVID